MRMEFVTICKVSHKRSMEVWVDICSTLLFLLNSNYVHLFKVIITRVIIREQH